MAAAADDRAAHLAFLADCFRDYRKFCGLLQIITKQNGRQQFVLNPIQRRRIARRTGLDIVLKARQVGMSTEECARDVWHFLTHPGARVVVVVQSMATHEPLKVISAILRVMLEGLQAVGVAIPFARVTTTEWELADGRSLKVIEAGATEATAQKKGRGGTITRLHCTELAFWEHAEATLLAMLECVPGPEAGSEIVFESTPNGAAGSFFERCQAAREGRSGYQFIFFGWYENPEYRLPLEPEEVIEPRDERERQLVALGCAPEQLKWRRRKIAAWNGDVDKFDQEYPTDPETCFVIKGRTFFDKTVCIRMLRECRDPLALRADPWRGAVRIWSGPERGKRYVIGVDTSEGIAEGNKPVEKQKHDAAAAIVRERETGRHVATLWAMLRPDALAEALDRLGRFYNLATIAVERNNHGHAVLLWLGPHLNYPRIYHDRDERPGWITTSVSRTTALDALEAEHRKNDPIHYATPDRALVGQQSTFVIGKNGKPEHAPGAHDDLVLADAICWDVVCKPDAFRGLSNIQPA
ncbi:hypothetical protein [Sorangium sp. So ce233]|uniref:hypothetical protein n=1 Tax=Sorangium sp. So ce233 TaxID=3133290 RepID=UPI003F5E1B82